MAGRRERAHCASRHSDYDGSNQGIRRRKAMNSLSGKQGPRYRHIAGETEPYETIGVEKLTPIIGAEISGVDLAGPLSNRTMDEIHRALAENLVIFFRDQHITPKQHLAFGRQFGELHIHPAAPHEGDDPALMKIYADKDSPRGMTANRPIAGSTPIMASPTGRPIRAPSTRWCAPIR